MTATAPSQPATNVSPEGGDAAQVAVADTSAALQCMLLDPDLPAPSRMTIQAAVAEIEALRAREQHARQQWRHLFNGLPDPVMLVSDDGTIRDINRAGMQEFGYRHEEIVGAPLRQLHPDAPADYMLPVLATVRDGATRLGEFSAMRSDGTRLHTETRTGRYLQGDESLLISVARTLETLDDTETRYRELLELIDKGIVIHNDNSQLLYANSAALRILGVRNALDLHGNSRSDEWLVLREDGSEMPYRELPMVRAVVDGRTVQSTVCGILHRTRGQLLWVSVTSAPQFAAGASTAHRVLTMFSDITAIKRDSAMFGRVQSLAHVGGWEWDRAPDTLYLTSESDNVLSVAGQAPASMAALLGSLPPTERSQLQAALQAAISDGLGFDLELRRLHNGAPQWLRINGEPMRDGPLTNRINGTLQDITDRKLAEESLREQARTDPLTGLMNRDAVLAELDARLSDPAHADVAALYIDLDRFKVVNDMLGHAAGDQVLLAATERLRQAVGTEGMIARLGGDEFLVVCHYDDDLTRPQRLTRAILDGFGTMFQFGDNEFAITASVGIAFAPLTGARPQTLIQNADMAMYDSKRRIRNGFQMFTPELARLRQERLLMETSLRRATDGDEFNLVFQPQVDLRSGRIVAAEALIRWATDAEGQMRPDRFIAHAEYSGDIIRIGDWVLREACRQIAQWRDDGVGDVRVAVNVSYRQLLGGDLAGRVASALGEYRLPGSALELEFTERVLIEDATETLQTLARLRDLGVLLTIDDFGEGYSALNYLRRLPVHGLKLSQTFVAGLPHNPSDMAVCQAVAGIAQSLDMQLVAEGVESQVQRQTLLDMGIPVGQGFLFSAGVSADEFAATMRAGAMLPLE